MHHTIYYFKIILYFLLTFDSSNAQLSIIIDKIVNHPNLKNGQWSFYAENLETGDQIANYKSDKIIYPASNLKLLTSAVALDLLGSDYQINTYIEYEGLLQDNGILKGNLFIRGSGDPSLGSTEIDGTPTYDSLMQTWVALLRTKGIKKITGNIIADDSYLDYMPLPGGWAWTDIGNYYAAGTSGLCINENLYYLYFKPGNYVGDKAIVLRTEPVIQNLKFINHMKTGKKGSGDNGYIYAAPWQYKHQLEGTIPAGVEEFSIKGALPDPAKFTADTFRKMCFENGIEVTGQSMTIREFPGSSTKRREIIIHHSPPLKDIVYRLNKKSVNLYAEQLLKLLGKEMNNLGSYASGLKVVKNWLKNNEIKYENLFLRDGSGLTRSNGITTKFMVDLLKIMKKKPSFKDFYDSLPIAGDTTDIGGIRNFCLGTRAAKNLRAKTGGHDRVQGYSGYVKNRKGEMIGFSMIANDYKGYSRTIRKLHEKMMIQLANL